MEKTRVHPNIDFGVVVKEEAHTLILIKNSCGARKN